jgi:hypothetical protein
MVAQRVHAPFQRLLVAARMVVEATVGMVLQRVGTVKLHVQVLANVLHDAEPKRGVHHRGWFGGGAAG